MKDLPITAEEAKKRGLHALTYPIDPVGEQWILDNILADLKRGGIPCAAVVSDGGWEIWRGSRFVQS